MSAWWEDLRRQPFEEQLRQVRGRVPYSTAAWFHHLQRLGQEEGRADRRRGVGLATLALECLEFARSSIPPAEHTRLLAKAWLLLGNAQRLALDYAAAEEAFANADVLLGDVSAPAELRAELAWLRYELRRFQRRFAEALVHAEKAVAISEGNTALLAQALLRRGGAWWHLQRFERAAADYRAAADEPTLAENPFLHCTALQGLADALIQQGAYTEARPPLEQAKRLATQLDDRASIFHTRWVEGLLATRCNDPETGEKHLQAAREGFRALGDLGHFAVISLDLAEVLAATLHHFPKVVQVCSPK
ncbi:MAG: hypothetical protein HC897_08355 [Thermoanaerobaculia bacterium]|nr:hypothetical protein [Thermoanaerobaculia bacterium]